MDQVRKTKMKLIQNDKYDICVTQYILCGGDEEHYGPCDHI